MRKSLSDVLWKSFVSVLDFFDELEEASRRNRDAEIIDRVYRMNPHVALVQRSYYDHDSPSNFLSGGTLEYINPLGTCIIWYKPKTPKENQRLRCR